MQQLLSIGLVREAAQGVTPYNYLKYLTGLHLNNSVPQPIDVTPSFLTNTIMEVTMYV